MAMKKICFKRTFSDGSQREAEGIPYTTKNGIKLALHKEGGFWGATELTTGKSVIRQAKYKKLKDVKAEVEETAPIVAKLLRKPKYQTISTGSTGKKLPATLHRSKEEAEVMKKSMEALGYKTEIQVVRTTTKQEAKPKAKEQKVMAKSKNRGYTAGVELPDGRKLISTPSAFRVENTTTNEIVLETKETAQTIAKKLSEDYQKHYGVKAKPYVGKPSEEREQHKRIKPKAKAGIAPKAKPAKADKPIKAPTYTVGGKTFATLKEAKAYKEAQKQKASKPCEIKEGNKKPSHKVVIFTARAKK